MKALPQNVGVIGFSMLGLILVLDQLLLPMLHLGPLPYKVSYFLAFFWFVSFLVIPTKTLQLAANRKDFYKFSIAIVLIVGCGVLGDFFIQSITSINSFDESFKSYTIYVLIILSFGLGLSSTKFNFKWLIYALLISIALNLVFILLKSNLPGWLVNFYYPPMTIEALGGQGLDSIELILEMTRPRGLFHNPNGSALMVNIIALFISVALRKNVLILKPNIVAILVIVMPIVLAVLLSSRGEILSAIIIGYFNYKFIFKRVSLKRKISYTFISVIVIASILSFLAQRIDANSTISENIKRAYSIFEVLNSSSNEALSNYEQRNQGIARPLLMFETAYKRFLYSPIFGSGFNTGIKDPFLHGTQHYHNDWFRLLITSGLIGFFAMIYIIQRFCWPISPLLVLPFILPGLVNTFMLNIPAVMFYFFMIAVMWTRLRVKSKSVTPNK